MEGAVKLTYDEMTQNCTTLKAYADDYETTAQSVTALVGTFTGSWEGKAEQVFEEDYTTLTTAMTTAVETMREITTLVESYVASMQEVEAAYGQSHVTVS